MASEGGERMAQPAGRVKARIYWPRDVMRVLGLDVGDRRIGMAVSDETGTLASALETLTRVGPRKDARAVAERVLRHEVEAVVVGLPLNMDGTRGAQAEKVLAFCEAIRARVRVPVVTLDERLTSVEAEQILARSGRGRKQRRALVDQVAATVILQEYLDHRKAAEAGKPRAL